MTKIQHPTRTALRPSLRRRLARGAVAGAAGTTALNLVTYADMALRGRGSSSTPEKTVEAAADAAGVSIPGDDETRSNRLAGLGPIMGAAVGIGGGTALGLLRAVGLRLPVVLGAPLVGAGVMAATDSAMAAAGTSAPTDWSSIDWLADGVPHVAYGLVTAWTIRELDRA